MDYTKSRITYSVRWRILIGLLDCVGLTEESVPDGFWYQHFGLKTLGNESSRSSTTGKHVNYDSFSFTFCYFPLKT